MFCLLKMYHIEMNLPLKWSCKIFTIIKMSQLKETLRNILRTSKNLTLQGFICIKSLNFFRQYLLDVINTVIPHSIQKAVETVKK